MSTDETIQHLVGEVEARIRCRLAADVYHHFKDRVTVRELGEALDMDFSQISKLHKRYYPDES